MAEDKDISHIEAERTSRMQVLLKDALEISRRIVGNNDRWTFTLLNGLAVVYRKQARYEEAERYLVEALEGRLLKLGDTHPYTLESLKNFIDLYEAWNKPEKAEEWRGKLAQIEDFEK
jgi:tetratricopeptide (TPR) repeat protein